MSDRISVQASQAQDPIPPAVKVTFGRRRLLTGGAVAAPILALRSGNVLAGYDPMSCRSVSAYMSGAAYLSHRPIDTSCAGRSPGYWGNPDKTWPIPRTTKMEEIWTSLVGQIGNVYVGKTLGEVLPWTGGVDASQRGAHLVAAWLNRKAGLVPVYVLPESVILAMGNAVLRGQLYYPLSPNTSVAWDGEKVVTYLKSTFG